MRRSACVVSWLSLAVTACGAPAAVAPPPTTAPAEPPAPPVNTPPPAAIAPVPVLAPAVPHTRVAGYDQPAQNILDVMHAPGATRFYATANSEAILLYTLADLPPMWQVAEPFLGLAGVRVEPRTRRKHDTPGGYGVNPCVDQMSIVLTATATQVPIALPAGGCVEAAQWSYDGAHFAFRNTSADAVELWVGTTATGAVHRVGDVRLNPMLGIDTVRWMADGKSLLVKLVPANQGPPPVGQVTLTGPAIQESTGQTGESSTYETRDTLKNKHDEDLFDYYATSQLAIVDSDSGRVTPVGKPAILADVDLAPDNAHLLVQTVHKPYSYVTTFDRFPRDIEVWDTAGAVTQKVASVPLADRVPVAGVRTGPREFAWRATDPATLVWAEALDGGDWKTKVPARDKLMMQKVPFTGAPVEVARLEQRFENLHWSEHPDLALLDEHDENRHWNRVFTINLDAPAHKPKLLFDLSSDEHYKAPGNPVEHALPNGTYVLRQTGTSIYFAGAGSSPDGDRPFFDRLDLATGKTERLFRADKTSYERATDFIDPAHKTLLTIHQSPSEPPNAFVRTLGDAIANPPAGEAAYASTAKPLTHIPDPTPIVRGVKKQLVKYKRKDGLDLSFTLLTPPGYQPGTRLPAILYAYPLDYADAKTAAQVTGSDKTFTRLFQYQLLLLAGYAIIDNAAFPIVGDPKRAYDHYTEQLVDDATAAVTKAVEMGVVDANRIGVTGHSHGALMTVNLVAHSKLFRAGVATSGSYNKTLTPFGFQNERRSVWAAPEVYQKVSPFFVADKIKTPLLIVHGAEDANPGTTPLQATKLYEAIRGNGGTTRLVMLPHEPHWYTAMESNEQLAYEMIRWFDTYVKNAAPPAPAK